MRVALVAGPGGSGVTTMAALTAVAAARHGRRTALVSADPSVQQILGPDSSRQRLTVIRPDPAAGVAAAWPTVTDYLSRFGVDDALEPSELAAVPAAGEVAVLFAVAEAARSGSYQALVLDAGSRPVDLLAIPETIGRLIDLVAPVPLRIMQQFGGLFGGNPAGNSAPAGDAGPEASVDLITSVLDRLMLARAVLTESAGAAVHLVTGLRPLRRAAARRLVPALAGYGAGLGRVLVNETTGQLDQDWPAEVLGVPAQAVEPTGEALEALSRSIFGDGDPLEVAPGPAFVDPVVSGNDGNYRLTIPLPLADRDVLDLARSGTDLLLTVYGRTRRVELPSVLRRCTVTGAAFADQQLTVTFAPDPRRWPQAVPRSARPTAAVEGTG